MRYIKDGLTIEANGGHRVLESLGYKSEWTWEAERRREEAMAKFKEAVARRWSCPECGKEMSALAQNKHHALHQRRAA